MSEAGGGGPLVHGGGAPVERGTANLVDVLERVLDKGIVIAGDIRIELLDIELLTIKLRLLIASVDRAREMGIDWWEGDRTLSRGGGDRELDERLARIERALGVADADDRGSAREAAGRGSDDGGSG